MSGRPFPHRPLAWLAIAALLLNGLVPLFAASAAAARRVAVAKICSVVGVATNAPAKHDDSSSTAAGHHGCALALLPIFAAPQSAPPEVGLAPLRLVAVLATRGFVPRDRRSTWLTQLSRAPPLAG